MLLTFIGYSYHALYDITSLGFQAENFNTIVKGITESIQMAHNNFEHNRAAKLLVASGELLESNIK